MDQYLNLPRSCSRRRAALIGLGISALLMSAAAPSAVASDSYAGSPRISADELRSLRGGLSIAGMDIQFGATIRTMVNGTLAAETVLTLNNNGGMDRTTTVADGSLLTPVSGNSADLAGAGVDLAALKNAQGFVIKDAAGLTAALNDITLQHANNIVVNTEPGRDIQQIVNMQLAVQNFTQVSNALHSDMLAGRITRAGQIDPMLSLPH